VAELVAVEALDSRSERLLLTALRMTRLLLLRGLILRRFEIVVRGGLRDGSTESGPAAARKGLVTLGESALEA
jgi:hypothetical protein